MVHYKLHNPQKVSSYSQCHFSKLHNEFNTHNKITNIHTIKQDTSTS